MRRRSASLIALCSIVGLGACSSGVAQTSNTVATFAKNTVFGTLPTTTTTTAPPPPATLPGGALVTAPPSTLAAGATKYTVVKGDYLLKIASRFTCKYQDILAANDYAGDANQFPFPNVGGTLTLPASCKVTATTAPPTTVKAGAATTTTKAGAKTTTTVKGASTAPDTATTAAAGGSYVVQSGDTLSKIATNLGTTAQAIATANGYSGDLNKFPLVPGKSIKLPAKAAT
jgi:LysM repeat protein